MNKDSGEHHRYEYDGLNLLRVDEKYDDETSPPDGIDSGDPWRTLEVATHKSGALGALLVRCSLPRNIEISTEYNSRSRQAHLIPTATPPA